MRGTDMMELGVVCFGCDLMFEFWKIERLVL